MTTATRVGIDRYSGPCGRGNDRRNHAARRSAANRRPEGKVARGASWRHQDWFSFPKRTSKDLAEIPDNVKNATRDHSGSSWIDRVLEHCARSKVPTYQLPEDEPKAAAATPAVAEQKDAPGNGRLRQALKPVGWLRGKTRWADFWPGGFFLRPCTFSRERNSRSTLHVTVCVVRYRTQTRFPAIRVLQFRVVKPLLTSFFCAIDLISRRARNCAPLNGVDARCKKGG